MKRLPYKPASNIPPNRAIAEKSHNNLTINGLIFIKAKRKYIVATAVADKAMSQALAVSQSVPSPN